MCVCTCICACVSAALLSACLTVVGWWSCACCAAGAWSLKRRRQSITETKASLHIRLIYNTSCLQVEVNHVYLQAKYFHWMCLGVLVNTHSEELLLEFKCSSSMNSTGRVNWVATLLQSAELFPLHAALTGRDREGGWEWNRRGSTER